MPAPLFQQLPENSSVLFIRLRNLGEAVLDTANIRALKLWRPDLRLSILVEAIYTELFEADPDIEPIPLLRRAADRRSSIGARLAVIRDLRRRRFDAVVNLHGGPTSAQLSLLSGAPRRAGAAHFRNGYAYNLRIPPAERVLGREGMHTVEYQFGQFKWLGLPNDEPGETRLHVSPDRRLQALAKLQAGGIDASRPFAVIAPTNEFYTKRWMPERFAAVADNLIGRGLQAVLTGAPTPEQRAQLEAVRAASSHDLPALSDLGIGQLVALIAAARLFIGNDSGPAHIAAAVKTPLAVLFGPASSVRWGPWKADSRLVQNYFPCNPCSMYTCKEFDQPECIRSITVEQVLSAVDPLLKIG